MTASINQGISIQQQLHTDSLLWLFHPPDVAVEAKAKTTLYNYPDSLGLILCCATAVSHQLTSQDFPDSLRK